MEFVEATYASSEVCCFQIQMSFSSSFSFEEVLVVGMLEQKTSFNDRIQIEIIFERGYP